MRGKANDSTVRKNASQVIAALRKYEQTISPLPRGGPLRFLLGATRQLFKPTRRNTDFCVRCRRNNSRWAYGLSNLDGTVDFESAQTKSLRLRSGNVL